MADALVIHGADELNARLRVLSARMPSATGRMLYQAGEAIRDYMVTNFLSGQRVRRITGRLAGGFHTVNIGTDRAVVGTRVIYARPLEEGGTFPVQPFMRARRRGEAKTISVRGHLRTVRGRHYARDAARLGAPTAVRAAERVIAIAIREAGLGN